MKGKQVFTILIVGFVVVFAQVVLGYQSGKALAKLEAKIPLQQ